MGLFGGGAKKVMEKGQVMTGTIVAIRVKKPGENDAALHLDEYVVMVGGRRLAVRQILRPDDRVRLGMSVKAWVRKDDVVIDWTGTMRLHGVDTGDHLQSWKSLKDWGGTGIEDSRVDYAKAARRGSPARLRIDAIEKKAQLGGLVRTNTVRCTVTIGTDEPYEVEIGRQSFPHYATHLVEVGKELPAWVDDKRLDRVTIDWPSAAEREPGVGVAPSPEGAGQSDSTVFDMIGVGEAPASLTERPPSFEPPPPIDGVSWDAYLEVTSRSLREKMSPQDEDALAQILGAAPGTWPEISQRWGKAMIRDAVLQRAFAAATTNGTAR